MLHTGGSVGECLCAYAFTYPLIDVNFVGSDLIMSLNANDLIGQSSGTLAIIQFRVEEFQSGISIGSSNGDFDTGTETLLVAPLGTDSTYLTEVVLVYDDGAIAFYSFLIEVRGGEAIFGTMSQGGEDVLIYNCPTFSGVINPFFGDGRDFTLEITNTTNPESSERNILATSSPFSVPVDVQDIQGFGNGWLGGASARINVSQWTDLPPGDDDYVFSGFFAFGCDNSLDDCYCTYMIMNEVAKASDNPTGALFDLNFTGGIQATGNVVAAQYRIDEYIGGLLNQQRIGGWSPGLPGITEQFSEINATYIVQIDFYTDDGTQFLIVKPFEYRQGNIGSPFITAGFQTPIIDLNCNDLLIDLPGHYVDDARTSSPEFIYGDGGGQVGTLLDVELPQSPFEDSIGVFWTANLDVSEWSDMPPGFEGREMFAFGMDIQRCL